MNNFRRKINFFKFLLFALIPLITVLFFNFCGEPNGNQDTNQVSQSTFVVLSEPTNFQVVPRRIEVIGSVYDTNGVGGVSIYLMPVFGGATNGGPADIEGDNLIIYRKAIDVSLDAFYYLWAEVSNSLSEITKTKLVLIQVKSSTFLDTTPPTISITVPENNQLVGSTYTFAGTANDDSSGVDKVYVKLDNGSYQALTVNNGVWSTSFTLTSAGMQHVMPPRFHQNCLIAFDHFGKAYLIRRLKFSCNSFATIFK